MHKNGQKSNIVFSQNFPFYRCFRPEKLKLAVEKFILRHTELRKDEINHFHTILELFENTKNPYPLILFHSKTCNLAGKIIDFAIELNFPRNKIAHLSYGYRENFDTEELIKKCAESGEWVIFQNCQLGKSWLQKLQYICDDIFRAGKMHANFRLWLGTLPSEDFPIQVLQNAGKMAIEERSENLEKIAQRFCESGSGEKMSSWKRGVRSLRLEKINEHIAHFFPSTLGLIILNY